MAPSVMDNKVPLQLMGATASPYTRKMLALLRYRRIPYTVRWGNHLESHSDFPTPRVKLLPTFYFPDDAGELEAIVDSTPIVRRLEADYPQREVLPADPLLRFLSDLIEDYADEWLTKVMFHYRWAHTADAAMAGPMLTFSHTPTLARNTAEEVSDAFSRRQIDRLTVVGSNAVTAQTIEESYQRFIEVFDALLAQREFLLGGRPCAADFAIHGQLTQLALMDPTPSALLRERSPRVRAWVDRVEDLSGLSPAVDAWLSPQEAMYAVAPLLSEIGRTYLPFLQANAVAASAGRKSMDCDIDGRRWTQPVFPYQVKCLALLRASYAELPDTSQALLEPVLQATACATVLIAT